MHKQSIFQCQGALHMAQYAKERLVAPEPKATPEPAKPKKKPPLSKVK